MRCLRPSLLAVLVAAAAGCAGPDPGYAHSPGPLGASPAGLAAVRVVTRLEWSRAFEAYGASGAFVLYEPETGTLYRSDATEATARFSPASTFKVYNALVALEMGAVQDPDSLFRWDGVARDVAAWNRDHSLRTGMEASTVWLYQRVAARVGADRYRAAFAREPYGSGEIGPDVESFWLDGSLRVSADEQVAFADRLRRGALAFRPDVQATVRSLLVRYDEAGGTLVGKTGWGGATRADGVRVPVGWLVGWVARDRPHAQGRGSVAVFAMRVVPDAPPTPEQPFDMVAARRALVRRLLTGEGWLDALR